MKGEEGMVNREGRRAEIGRRRAGKKMQINSAKDLDVYKQAFDLAMEIFQLSKRWPVEEKFSREIKFSGGLF